MKTRWWVLAVAISLATGSVSDGLDSVKTAERTLSGRVVGMAPLKVNLEQGAGGSTPKEIPVNQIQTVFFEDEPGELRAAKLHVIAGRYAEALTALERIKGTIARAEIQQDIEFYKALCAAKTALNGNGKIADAGRMMKAFADANTTSYHSLEAAESVGDLLLAVGQYGPAAEYYGRLDKAPWPDYKMRAGVATGQALLAQEKIDQAADAFYKVIATEAEGKSAQQQRTLAKLGKAATLVALKKPDEAVKMVEEILKTADPEDSPLLARAYNVLGSAHRQAGRVKEALLAFLQVDLLYPSLADAHAEALANLADLWGQVRKEDRASRARKTLEEQYPESRWTKKGGG
jgi:tetratricopeptide (TPR) repeat protein